MFEIGKILKKQDSSNPEPSTEAKKKVLVIEDELDISEIYKQILVENGFEAYTALNGEEGLSKIKETNPNLIFLDLRMPVMDGKTMLNHLKNDEEYISFKYIPVVILTNSGNTENLRETMTLGDATEFLVKSNINPDQVAEIAKRYTA